MNYLFSHKPPRLLLTTAKDYPTNFETSGGSPAFNNGMLGVGVKSS